MSSLIVAAHDPAAAPPPPPPAMPAPPPPQPSAFQPVPSASSEGAQPPPVHPAVKTSPPGGGVGQPRFGKHHHHSPTNSSTASDSNSPIHDEEDEEDRARLGTDPREKTFDWPAHSSYDERRQLIGTEEESSERPSSDEDEDKNPWTITREQLNYYTTQFFSMQPNPRGAIPGTLAKEFFEKSRLPISELRKIWQLSDVTKDGCLSLEEFLTAMHLVVLRRNDIDLPDTLPPCLQPMALRNKVVDRHNKDLYNPGGSSENHADDTLLLHEDSRARMSADAKRMNELRNDSDVCTPNSLTSPGPKPVNFDFHDARMNPHIIQPVPVRLSPDSPVIATTSDDDENRTSTSAAAALTSAGVKQGRREVVYEQLWNQEDAQSAAESLSSLTLLASDRSSSLQQQHPQRRAAQRSEENTTDEEDLDDGCSTEIDGLQDLSPSPPALPRDPNLPPYFSNALHRHRSPPPPPPPRPGKSHARSSSLDLTLRPPPAVPPRNSEPSKRIEEEEKVIIGIGGRDSRSLQMSIHQYREKNSVIARTINELHQEVSDTLEERIALEFHLEQLKSFGD